MVAAELTRRFAGARTPALTQWQFTLTATDANRHLLRYARHVTGRPRVAVIDGCQHGTVDEAFATLDAAGAVVERRGNIGAPVPPALTTAVLPFNDLGAIEAALATGTVAAVLLEPAMTNIGGGVPVAAFGMTEAISRQVTAAIELEDIDVGGVGGTLAGNALSMAATRATLAEVLTEEAFARMTDLATAWTDGVQDVLDATGLPWHVTRLGARAEYAFSPEPPHDGAEAGAADDFPLQQYLHLQALNRRVLLTPFHNMALMSPATTRVDVDAHTAAFAEAAAALRP